MPYPQLSGRTSIERPRSGPTAVWLAVGVLAVVFIGWQYWPRPTPTPPATPSTVTSTTPVVLAPNDTELRLAHAGAELAQAAEQLNTARRALAALSPDLARSYLSFEERRAESAWNACEAAARAIEQARSDIQPGKTNDKE